MLNELQYSSKVVGVKQLKKALRDGKARKVFAADDADPRVTQPILDLCAETDIPVEHVPSMAALGNACGIEVGSAVAGLLKD